MKQCMTNMDKKGLLHWIDMVSFCMYDMALYLDTHPDDKEAMEYFNQYQRLRKEAVSVYSKKYEPLLLDEAAPDCKWKWVLSPWPWEGGCR